MELCCDLLVTESIQPDDAFRESVLRMASNLPEPLQSRLVAWFSSILEPPDPDENHIDLDSYVKRLRSLFDQYTPSQSLDQRMSVAQGWWTIINRQASAVAALTSLGFDSESIPIARSLFEHSMALTVLSKDSSDLASGIVSSTFGDFRTGFERASTVTQDGYTPSDLDGFLRLLNAMQSELSSDSESQWPRRFSEHVSRLGVKDVTYPFYQGLCSFSHPTLAGVLGFVNWQDRFSPTKTPNRWVLHGPAGIPLLWAVQSQCWGALAIHSMLPEGLPWRSEVIAIARILDIPLVETLFG
jgi:Family of unknown function (DUF5677)